MLTNTHHKYILPFPRNYRGKQQLSKRINVSGSRGGSIKHFATTDVNGKQLAQSCRHTLTRAARNSIAYYFLAGTSYTFLASVTLSECRRMFSIPEETAKDAWSSRPEGLTSAPRVQRRGFKADNEIKRVQDSPATPSAIFRRRACTASNVDTRMLGYIGSLGRAEMCEGILRYEIKL